MVLRLERWADSPYGTFGTLVLPDGWTCFTVERPWLDNQSRISCIPAGLYKIKLGTYTKGGYPAYDILDVPGRSQIKIHKANLASELEGCIAPGTGLGVFKGEWSVMNSGTAFEHLMAAMAGHSGEIDIEWKTHPVQP